MTAGIGPAAAEEDTWVLTLYVSGASPRSAEAIDNVRTICDDELAGRVDLRVVDVGAEAGLVVSDGVIAVPTLVRRHPAPLRLLVGNLSDRDRVTAGLDLEPQATTVGAPDAGSGRA